MKLSERKAKEVLDFLVHKINPYADWSILSWNGKFTIHIYFQEVPGIICTGLFRRSNNYAICWSYLSSCTCMLNTLIDEASQSSIIYSSRNVEYEIIHKMTTLEQILIDMDLSANI